jgi:hypothetical protein
LQGADLLQAAHFVANSLAKSKHQDHSELVSSWGFKHLDLKMPSKVDSENEMLEMGHMEITKFHSSTAVFSVVMKIKIVKKLLLSELQRNTRRPEG